MELFRKKQPGSAMDLVQITGEGSGRPGRRVVFEVLLTVAMSAGCWFTYFSMFPNPVNDIASIAMIAVLPPLLYFVCRSPLLGRFLIFYVFIITAVYFVLFYESVWNGFLVMANIVVEVLNNEFDAGLIPFEITGAVADWSRDTLMAMIPVMLLESSAIAYSVFYKEPLAGFIMTAIPVLTGLCFEAEPSIWLLLLMLLCWTGLLVLSAVARPVSRKKRRPIYIQNDKNSSLPYIFLSICLVLLTGYVLIFSGDDYRPPDSVDEAKTAVIAAEEHIRYDKLNGDDIDTLSRGDLTQTHPLEYTENTVLKLRMQMMQSIYLRGFAGGDYENGKWTEAAEGAYSGEYTGVMEWLSQQNFYPWMQQDRLYRMSENYDFMSVDVTNVNGSSKYIYLPYEAALSGDTMPDEVNYVKDNGAYARGLTGQREYTFKVFSSRLEDYSESGIAEWLAEVKQSPEWEEYAEPEAVYRRYVYDTYLYVPEKEYEMLKAVDADKCLGKTIEYTLHYIRKTFDDNYEYNIEQSAAPDGADELEYFLSDSHKGNDMHFATAAALMFRSAGIPARYAEGYYLSPDEVKLYTDMSDISYDVLDSNAHCWVEIYIDEIGWFPVEVIPGYYDMEKQQTQEVEEDEKLEQETKKMYEDEAPEDSEPQQSSEKDKKEISPLWLILLIIIAAVILYEVTGRIRIRKMLSLFGTEFTDVQVYAMYKYVGRIMSFDGHPIPADPYDGLDEISERYDDGSEMSFAVFLRLVNQVRFGGISLNEEEHKKMADYAVCTGRHVYSKQSRFRKFLMKFIIFCV
ncbi:MAG: transglutaminase-like domain-containing protein [Lentihominibacter sp.]